LIFRIINNSFRNIYKIYSDINVFYSENIRSITVTHAKTKNVMGGIISILLRALGFVAATAGGWAISDIFNEHQTSKQAGAAVSIVDAAVSIAKANKIKWLYLAIGSLASFLVVVLLLKPILSKVFKQKETPIL